MKLRPPNFYPTNEFFTDDKQESSERKGTLNCHAKLPAGRIANFEATSFDWSSGSLY